MKTFMTGLWPYLTGRSQNPIYKRDLARWSASRVWRRLGLLLPLIMLGGSAIVVGIPMAVMMPVYIFPLYEWSSAVIAGLAALQVGQEIVKQLACLCAAGLAGVALAADAEEIDLLRLSPLPDRQIILAKLAAALRPLLPLLIISTIARLALILTLEWSRTLFDMRAMLNMALMSIRASMPPIVADIVYGISVWGYQLWELLARQANAIRSGGMWPPWLIYYLLQPAIDLALFTAIGLLAAGRARARSGALQGALGLAAAVWIGGYLAERLLAIGASALWDLSAGSPLFVAVVQWTPGMPAMDGGYIVTGWPFAVMLIGIIAGKLALLWLLGGVASRQVTARYGMPHPGH